jgi:hypothetical protein
VYKYGEFLPIEFSPFGYNATTAQEYFPLTKEEAILKNYNWKEPENKDYKIDILLYHRGIQSLIAIDLNLKFADIGLITIPWFRLTHH